MAVSGSAAERMTNPRLPHANDYVALGQALAQLRHAAGLTQVQAGERIGVRSQFVSEVETGRRGMRWLRDRLQRCRSDGNRRYAFALLLFNNLTVRGGRERVMSSAETLSASA